MAESWTISVAGRVYGPYSLEQMQAFHAENRLADHSLVARAGEEQFHPAIEDVELAPLFQVAEQPQPLARQVGSGERLGGFTAGLRIGCSSGRPHPHTFTCVAGARA